MLWQRLHWSVGILCLVGFLAEGAYMRYGVQVFNLDDAPRLIYRSRFLLLLLAGVANLALSGAKIDDRYRRIASAIVLLAPIPLVFGFVLDPAHGTRGSEWTTWTMRALFAAAVLLVLVNRPRRSA